MHALGGDKDNGSRRKSCDEGLRLVLAMGLRFYRRPRHQLAYGSSHKSHEGPQRVVASRK